MNQPAQLKRGLSLWLLVFYGQGNILDAGIYVLVGKVAGSAGLFAPITFLLASLVAAAGHTGQVDPLPGAVYLQPDESVVAANQVA